MFIDLNWFLRWAMWPMGLLFAFNLYVFYSPLPHPLAIFCSYNPKDFFPWLNVTYVHSYFQIYRKVSLFQFATCSISFWWLKINTQWKRWNRFFSWISKKKFFVGVVTNSLSLALSLSLSLFLSLFNTCIYRVCGRMGFLLGCWWVEGGLGVGCWV